LNGKPGEELNLRGSPNFPNRRAYGSASGPEELSVVSGVGRVKAILSEVPNNIVLHLMPKVHLPNESPKGDELPDMIHRQGGIYVDLRDPSIIVQGLLDIPLLPSRNIMYERGDVTRLFATEPRGIPKRSFLTIAYGNLRRGIEKTHVHLVARILQARPDS